MKINMIITKLKTAEDMLFVMDQLEELMPYEQEAGYITYKISGDKKAPSATIQKNIITHLISSGVINIYSFPNTSFTTTSQNNELKGINNSEYYFTVNLKKFYNKYERLKEIQEKISDNNNKGKEWEFDENESVIKLNGKKCHLPPNKNEYYLCKVMFNNPANEFVDWLEIFDEAQDLADGMDSRGKRKVQDTMLKFYSKA